MAGFALFLWAWISVSFPLSVFWFLGIRGKSALFLIGGRFGHHSIGLATLGKFAASFLGNIYFRLDRFGACVFVCVGYGLKISPLFYSLNRNCGVLGNLGIEYYGFHAVCSSSKRSSGGPGYRHACIYLLLFVFG